MEVTGKLEKSPRKLPRKKSKNYSSCLLYNAVASEKLGGLFIAACNPAVDSDDRIASYTDSDTDLPSPRHRHTYVVSEKMACNCCNIEFVSRSEQRDHYKSDWHRYNLKLRLKGFDRLCEDDFEKIAGDVSSISGSEDEADRSDTDTDTGRGKSKPVPIPQHVRSASALSDSESEGGLTLEGTARKYPKVYFKNKDRELVSVYRCLLYHKKKPPSNQSDLAVLASLLPLRTKWAVCMSAGGHFAAAVFEAETLVLHKTFHRYVVRAKRGSAQSSRDAQGGAPKSAGASLRRYNEAALSTDVQELLSSWSEQLKKCDLVFLRAASFNRQMFYGGKNPPFKKDDYRIRTIPFPTRRPTLNEVKRVHQMLASVECYGDAADVQDFVPMSPLRHFSPESGQLEIVADDMVRTSPRRLKEKDASTSSLASSPKNVSGSPSNKQIGRLTLPDHLDSQPSSSATSTASDSDLIEVEEEISTLDLKEHDSSVKRHRKRNRRKRRPSIKHQIEPEGDVFAEEKYHLRNALFTACKVGDSNSLLSLLAILNHPASSIDSPQVEGGLDGTESLGISTAREITLECRTTESSIEDVTRETTTKDATMATALEDATRETTFEIRKPVSCIDDVTRETTLEDAPRETTLEDAARETTIVNKTNTGDGTARENIVVDLSRETVNENTTRETTTNSNTTRETTTDSHLAVMRGQHRGNNAQTEIEEHPAATSLEAVGSNDKAVLCSGLQDGKHTSETDNENADGVSTRESVEVDIGVSSIDSQATGGNADTMSEILAVKPDHLPGLNLGPTKPRFELSPLVALDVLNEPFGDNGTTLLHVTSKAGHVPLIRLLMKAGADPGMQDKAGKVPYNVSNDKEMRNEFRRFMGDFPDKFDYSKAQIPSPLTAEMQAEKHAKEADRKRQQRKAKQERMKDKKAENVKLRAEEQEQRRYLSLSDREKRAMAAERRLLQQREVHGDAPVVCSRCWQCAVDITGKIPFEYRDFKFCSSKCLQLHRKSVKS